VLEELEAQGPNGLHEPQTILRFLRNGEQRPTPNHRLPPNPTASGTRSLQRLRFSQAGGPRWVLEEEAPRNQTGLMRPPTPDTILHFLRNNEEGRLPTTACGPRYPPT
jgi:hypothetical protein